MTGKSFSAAPLRPLLDCLDRSEFDLVMVERPLLQDATWLEKVHHGRCDELSGFSPEAFATLD